jgi:ligand-binding SRPBCC domain-containing protein
MLQLEYRSLIAAPVDVVFSFHEREDAISLLTPRLLFPSVERLKGEGLAVGKELVITTGVGVRTRWHARHTDYVRNRLFADEQVSGPMRYWRHEHHFLADASGTLLVDHIRCEPPLGAIGRLLTRLFIGALFAYRHAVTKRMCEGTAGTAGRLNPTRSSRISP